MGASPTIASSSLSAAGASTPSVATPFVDTLAGKALTGAGIGALGGAITNPNDPMKGALIGAGTGALGGAGAGALAGEAGTGGVMGGIGDFAAAHPYITAGAIGLPTSMALNSMASPSTQKAPAIDNTRIDPNKYKYTQPQWTVYQPTYMAAGGLTDVDSYMSDAQNVPQDVKVPNPIDVANPSGYLGNSVQSYAIGGDIRNMADSLAKNSVFGFDSASDIPVIGGLFKKPEDVATLTPEEKQKLMAMAAQRGGQLQQPQPQQMAQGGIANLGSYSAGGKPNLLHGAGDGVSDDIPATIGGKQPARLAAGEYVVPSRIVSELGNGSTDAGAQRLDEMVKRIQAGRHKTLKGKDYAKDTKPYKHLPA